MFKGQTMSAAETTRKLKNSAKKTATARKKADNLWGEHKQLIRKSYATGDFSYQDIADLVGLTKARVWQINTEYEPKGK